MSSYVLTPAEHVGEVRLSRNGVVGAAGAPEYKVTGSRVQPPDHPPLWLLPFGTYLYLLTCSEGVSPYALTPAEHVGEVRLSRNVVVGAAGAPEYKVTGSRVQLLTTPPLAPPLWHQPIPLHLQ